MLTAHNGQLASFVCVMSYVFKFSIAYIHVYNDEKKPWTVMVRGFSCTCNKQEGKRFQLTSVTVLLSLSNIPAIYHSFPYPQKPLHTTPSIGHHMSSYCYVYTQGNARIHETWPDEDNYADGHPEESHQNKHRSNNNKPRRTYCLHLIRRHRQHSPAQARHDYGFFDATHPD